MVFGCSHVDACQGDSGVLVGGNFVLLLSSQGPHSVAAHALGPSSGLPLREGLLDQF